MNINKLYKNWFIHNCVGHPLMYFISFLSERLARKVHDATLPEDQSRI